MSRTIYESFNILGTLPSLSATRDEISEAKRAVVRTIIKNRHKDPPFDLRQINNAADDLIKAIDSDGLEYGLRNSPYVESTWDPRGGGNWEVNLPTWWSTYKGLREELKKRKGRTSYDDLLLVKMKLKQSEFQLGMEKEKGDDARRVLKRVEQETQAQHERRDEEIAKLKEEMETVKGQRDVMEARLSDMTRRMDEKIAELLLYKQRMTRDGAQSQPEEDIEAGAENCLGQMVLAEEAPTPPPTSGNRSVRNHHRHAEPRRRRREKKLLGRQRVKSMMSNLDWVRTEEGTPSPGKKTMLEERDGNFVTFESF